MGESPRLEQLRRRVREDPASVAFAALAEEYRRAQRLPEAIETARAGLARHPSYVIARVTLGRALFESGATAAARRELQQALDAAPENLAAIRALAELLHDDGALDQARALARRGVALAPQDRELRSLLDRLGPTPAPPGGPPPSAAPSSGAPLGGLPPPAASSSAAPPDAAGDPAPPPGLAALERWLDGLVRERLRRERQPAAVASPGDHWA